jgi:hypothetical protein
MNTNNNNNNFQSEKSLPFYQNSAHPNVFAISNFQNLKMTNERTQIEEEPQIFYQNNINKPQAQPQTFFQNNFYVTPNINNNNERTNNEELINVNMNQLNNLNSNLIGNNDNPQSNSNGDNLVINRNQIFPQETQEKENVKRFEENFIYRRENEEDDQSINFLKLTTNAGEEDQEYDKNSPVFSQSNPNFLSFSERAPPIMNYNVPGNTSQ